MSNSSTSFERISAVIWRYWFLLRSSWPRVLELLYWPTVSMVLWGFISGFMAQNSSYVAQAAGGLLAGVLLWDVFFRAQLGVSVSFLEEMWSRNLGHLFVTPLRPLEWVAALLVMSMIRTIISVLPAALLAIWFYHYSLFDLGLPLLAFFINLLVMGWWIGLLVIAVILHKGLGAEGLAWMTAFVLVPVSAVYYPVSALPEWLQQVAMAIPASHVFEGMRTVLFDKVFDWQQFGMAVLLNGFYLLIAVLVFLGAFEKARERGALLQQGE